jgi:hypothetical protein
MMCSKAALESIRSYHAAWHAPILSPFEII